tara:strand:- start:3367 stop:5181 length:1815 start_codon:yes stop_codon:yes gene_type:complete
MRISKTQQIYVFSIVLISGLIICFWNLGSTGLIDETSPKFASAAREMIESGDWLTPRANGIPRFDKPPLIYWLMGFFYSLPFLENFDNLGSWSGRLPSAISTLFLSILIADTFLRFSEEKKEVSIKAVISSLTFTLSPLVIIWSRTAVSDSLLCSTLGISLLLFWRRIVSKSSNRCYSPWIILGLSILVKGPISLLLAILILSLFIFLQSNPSLYINRINPILGLFITTIISSPWYIIEYFKEGRVFIESFFGYHNLQRFTSVVNSHSEPWWFFIQIMIIASLPFTPFLFLGIINSIKDLINNNQYIREKSKTGIFTFSLCWMFIIFIFFTSAATKLPSYWLPATPASAILVTYGFTSVRLKTFLSNLTVSITSLVFFGLFLVFLLSGKWLILINDPEMPDLAFQISSSGILLRSTILFGLIFLISLIIIWKKNIYGIFLIQIGLIIGQLAIMDPIRNLADEVRQLPLRNISKLIIDSAKPREPISMIGIRKPSLHFYTRKIILYENSSPVGLINLLERLKNEDRFDQYKDIRNNDSISSTMLVVIDDYSFSSKLWREIDSIELGSFGIYKLLRIKIDDIEDKSRIFVRRGIRSNWETQRYEKF